MAWDDAISEPVKTAKPASEDTSYDMEEYSAPANESTFGRLSRYVKKAAKESGLTKGGKITGESLAKTLVAGPLEAAGTLASGAVATPAAGLTGLVAGVGQGVKNIAQEAWAGFPTKPAPAPIKTREDYLAALKQREENPPDENMSALDRAAQVTKAVQSGMTYKPRTASGEAITEAAALPFSLASEYGGKLGGAVGKEIGGAIGGQRGEIYGEAAGRAVGEVGPGVAATALGAEGAIGEAGYKGRPVAPSTPKQAQAIKGQALGYVLPPSEANPTLLNKFITGYGGKIQTQQEASIKNQAVTNSLVKQALGVAQDVDLSYDVLDAVRREAGKSYQAIKNTKEPIYSNQKYKDAIRDLSADWQVAERDFPEIKTSKANITELQKTMNKPYISPTGAIEMIKDLRGNATANFKDFTDPSKQALAKAQRKMADALEDLVEDNLKENTLVYKKDKNKAAAEVVSRQKGMGPELESDAENLLREYRAARQVIAKSYDVEAALLDPTGNVNAQRLGKLLKDQKISGHLKDVAEFATTFKKATQMPETIGATPGISPLDIATAGIEGGTALAAGKPGLAAGLMGTVVGRPVARGMGLSEKYQRGPASAQQYDMSGRQLIRKLAPTLGAGAQKANIAEEAQPYISGEYQ